MSAISRRSLLQAGAAAATYPAARRARAAGLVPIRLNLSWYAQAPVGGFYQALARGFYRDAGFDVTIQGGGPQVSAVQLLAAGACDFITGYDFQTLRAVAAGIPLVTVAASFQRDLQGMILHAPATSLADLRGKRILIGTAARQSFWPWLQKRYGLTDAQVAPYTFNLQPFFLSPDVAVQGYASSEMFDITRNKIAARFFRFSDEGYPPYGTTLVTTRQNTNANPALVRRFVRASMLGWRDYLGGDPAPGNALIVQAATRETPERLAFGIQALRDGHALTAGDTALKALGAMTQERWRATHDFMLDNNLLDRATPWQDAFDTSFAEAANVSPT